MSAAAQQAQAVLAQLSGGGGQGGGAGTLLDALVELQQQCSRAQAALAEAHLWVAAAPAWSQARPRQCTSWSTAAPAEVARGARGAVGGLTCGCAVLHVNTCAVDTTHVCSHESF